MRIFGNQTHAVTGSLYVSGSLTVSGSLSVTGGTITGQTVSRGGTIVNDSGVTTGNFIVWRAPYGCTVTAVKAYRVGGTGATINARKNGASNHLSSNLSVSSTDTWIDGGAVQNTSYSAGDALEIMVLSVTGTVTQIAIQVDFIVT